MYLETDLVVCLMVMAGLVWWCWWSRPPRPGSPRPPKYWKVVRDF